MINPRRERSKVRVRVFQSIPAASFGMPHQASKECPKRAFRGGVFPYDDKFFTYSLTSG
jgi:hypothetical protein